jgi:hypothetical protein
MRVFKNSVTACLVLALLCSNSDVHAFQYACASVQVQNAAPGVKTFSAFTDDNTLGQNNPGITCLIQRVVIQRNPLNGQFGRVVLVAAIANIPLVPKFANPVPNVFIFIGYQGQGGGGQNGFTYTGAFWGPAGAQFPLGISPDFVY